MKFSHSNKQQVLRGKSSLGLKECVITLSRKLNFKTGVSEVSIGRIVGAVEALCILQNQNVGLKLKYVVLDDPDQYWTSRLHRWE